MELNRKHKVYFHLNPHTKEVFYVGIGIRSRHIATSHRTRLWKNYVNKHGFIALIIEEELTADEAREREKYYIKLYGRKDLIKGELLNLTDGGEGAFGAIRSAEVRARMSAAAKRSAKRMPLSESHKANISNALKGKKHSEAHKEQNRISKIQAHAKYGHMGMKGKNHSEETKLKMAEVQAGRGIGRKLPPETVLKMVAYRTGRKLSDETKRKIGEANRIKVKEYWQFRKEKES